MSSRWCGTEVRKGGCQLRHHLTAVQIDEITLPNSSTVPSHNERGGQGRSKHFPLTAMKAGLRRLASFQGRIDGTQIEIQTKRAPMTSFSSKRSHVTLRAQTIVGSVNMRLVLRPHIKVSVCDISGLTHHPWLNHDQRLKRSLLEQANADRNDHLDVYPNWRVGEKHVWLEF
ncbi:hypothetical protein AVEN_236152-1 [Araneus ventricosus]|uniref:Uncharacterized protein n=1 Tax=Araneus ventricosus TaxID=182803 RepID=A0A4Y2PC62_ARAVE|nr:hypothetical protein AVEN_236152-1 [Araneus ventricosus]